MAIPDLAGGGPRSTRTLVGHYCIPWFLPGGHFEGTWNLTKYGTLYLSPVQCTGFQYIPGTIPGAGTVRT